MTDPKVKFACKFYCCFLDKVCFNLPKRLCIMHSFAVRWGKRENWFRLLLPSYVADIFIGDWHSFLVRSKSWHFRLSPLLQTNKQTNILYRVCRAKGCKVTRYQSWRSQKKICRPDPNLLEPVSPGSTLTWSRLFSKFDGPQKGALWCFTPSKTRYSFSNFKIS